ncbi:MAG: sigma-70 family RNA polymerase sigma factor [Eubacteriales bacterium]|nr:sigma-70 family RNA polymerase sigma factor [Eubacteriales bacterium]
MKDELILQKMRSGDPAGLEALMDAYIPYVSAVVWNILRGSMPAEDAEEVVSDVFLAAWKQAADLRPESAKAWLGAVARNAARSRLRKMGRDLPLEEDVLELPDELTPVTLAEKAEERQLVRKALDTLGEPDREIFLRHYYYAQELREISQTMGINESTVKTKLRRGRMRLKTLLLRWGVA